MNQEQDTERPLYATLRYDVLKKLKITPVEYMILDMVYHLSAKHGFCYKSSSSIAYDLDMTDRGVRKIIVRLVERELLTKNNQGLVCAPAYTNSTYLVQTNSRNKVPQAGTKFRKKKEQSSGQAEQSSAKAEQSTNKNYIEQHLELHTTNVVGETPVYGKKELNDLFNYWEEKTGVGIASKRQANRNACNNLYKKMGAEKVRQLIDGVALAQNDQYAPRICDFCDLQAKLTQLLTWGKTRNIATPRIIKI
jgi:hypothetical protein